MTRTISIVVEDRPAPQGSKRHVGHGVMIESSKYVKTWREAVKTAAIARKDLTGADDGYYFPTGPVRLTVHFYFRRPKSHYRTGRNSQLLRDDAPNWVDKMPDLSKLIRSTEDALTAAGIWRDDAQVAITHAEQLYSDASFEGAEITISEVAA